MPNVVRAALVQSEWTGDKESMVAKNIEYARQAAAQGAQILCFQEIFSGPYFCTEQRNEHFDTAEPVPDGPTMTKMIALARETGMVLVVPIFEVEDTGHYYNTAAAFIYIGFHPNTEYLKGLLEMDALGHVYTDIHMRTGVPGIYACGDARADSTRQLGAAVGDGITAALAAYHDLQE